MKKVLFLFLLLFVFSFSYALKITEVYFDGTNEFIEIYNNNNSIFSGTITLSGAKRSKIDLSLNLSWKNIIVVWDNLAQYISGNVNYKSWVIINLTDTKAINIKLLQNWQVLDSFFVNQNDVKKIDNKKTSFEKIFSWNKEIIKAVENPKNAKQWYLINPGYVYIKNITWWNEKEKNNNIYCKINMSRQNDLYTFYFIWNSKFNTVNWYLNDNFLLSWQSMSKKLSNGNYIVKWEWIDFSWNNCEAYYWLYIDKHKIMQTKNILTWKLEITEIHPKNDNFSEYVELQAFWNVSWNYILEGFARWNTKLNLNVSVYSWNYIILAKSYSWFLYTWNVLLFNSLSLSDVGEQLSIIQSGQLIDKVEYTKWTSLYFTKTENNIRQFKTNSIPTPWFALYVKNYFKTKERTNCSIVLQSYTIENSKLKMNFTAKIDNKKYCNADYQQIWTYSGGQITWTCNPNTFSLNKENQVVNFKIKDFSWNTICKDDYNIFYEKEDNKQENLNCFIKVQSKTTPFLSKSSINLITVVNWQEIQNSNKNYTCTYTLSWQVLSNKCNPNVFQLNWWLYKLDLSVKSKTWQTCQTSYYLNLPSQNTKILYTKRKIDSFSCLTLSSNDLKNLVYLINWKYKSKYTLKKIFDPIKYLYIDTTPLIDKCISQNSTKLKELVGKIRKKYKSKYILNKIFGQTRQDMIQFKWLKIFKISPQNNIILTGQYMSWLSIQIWKRRYNLNSNVFTWYNKTNWCVNLFKDNLLLDSKCFINWQIYYTDSILFIKDKIIYSDNWKLILKENKPYIDLKKKLKKLIPKIIKYYKKLIKQKQKYKKIYVKESKYHLYYQWNYTILKNKYRKLRQNFSEYRSKKYNKLKNKNEYIKSLKKKISFLKKFIVSIKKNIDKNVYQTYLKEYRKIK